MAAAPKEALLRVQGPRSRTGCSTCKLRHIKCSEEHPYCRKCIKARRPCYYTDSEPNDTPVQFVLYACPRESTRFPGLTQAERRCLYHFQNRTALELSGPCKSDLWSDVMVHIAQYAPSVRHAIFALSSTHEHFTSTDQAQTLLLDFSMHHYNKAIRQAIRSEPDQSFSTLLLTCLVFCALEALKGNASIALQHAWSGIQIIAKGSNHPPNQHHPPIPNDVLIHIYYSLQISALELGDLSPAKVYHTVICTSPLPSHLVDVESALLRLKGLMTNFVVWIDEFELYYRESSQKSTEIPAQLRPTFDTIVLRFAVWEQAIRPFDSLQQRGDSNQHNGYYILKIYQVLYKMMFRIVAENIKDLSAFEQEISDILKQSEAFILATGDRLHKFHIRESTTTADVYPQQKRPTFTVSLGVISILFEIANLVNKPELRAEAMRLLKACNRREGVWDSELAYQLAQKRLELEHELAQARQDNGVQDAAKVAQLRSIPKAIWTRLLQTWWTA